MKKNGFTLIELLAVIIVLAIVALIVTPIVLNVVDDAKASAAESNAAYVVSGINSYCAQAQAKDRLNNTTDKDICKNGVEKTEVSTMVDLGKTVVNAVTYDTTNRKVTGLNVTSNGKNIYYNGTTFAETSVTTLP